MDEYIQLLSCLRDKWKDIEDVQTLEDNVVSSVYKCKHNDEYLIVKISYSDINYETVECHNISYRLSYSPEILDVYMCKDLCVIIMKYVEGRTYSDILSDRDIRYRDKVKILYTLVIMMLNLYLIHNVSHRDLHTDNVIVQLKDMNIQIIDFDRAINTKDKSFIFKKKEYDTLFKDINVVLDTERKTKISMRRILNNVYDDLYMNIDDDIQYDDIKESVSDVFLNELLRLNVSDDDIEYILYD